MPSPVMLTTVAPFTKFEPLNVTPTLVACAAEAGLMDASAGCCATAAVTVIVAQARTAVFLVVLAHIRKVAGAGTTSGAVYRPSVEIVPNVAFPPGTPFT